MRIAFIPLLLLIPVAGAQTNSCQVQTVAGPPTTFSPDDTPALQTRLADVRGVAIDSKGTIYFSDTTNHRVRKIATDGSTVTVAGTGVPGWSGDGGQAVSAQLDKPGALAFDSHDNLYIADTANYRVRVVAPDGTISTVAGNGGSNDRGDGGLATNANFRSVSSLAIGPDGSLYVLDSTSARVRRVSGGLIAAYAGGAAMAQPDPHSPIHGATGIAIDRSGNLLVAAREILLVAPNGKITTFAGQGSNTGDGGAALTTTMDAVTLATDPAGDVYLYDADTGVLNPSGYPVYIDAVRMIDPTGTIHHIATIENVAQIAVASSGVVAAGMGMIQQLAATDSATPLAGSPDMGYGGDQGPATSATVWVTPGVAFSPSGILYFSDAGNHRVRAVDTHGNITTVAGNGIPSRTLTKNEPAIGPTITAPEGLAVDSAGNLFIADGVGAIYKVNAQGTIQLWVGGGTNPVSQSPKSLAIFQPYQVAVDSAGNLYFLDLAHLVKKVSAAGDKVTAAPGGGEVVPATQFGFTSTDIAVAVDPHDNLFVVYFGTAGMAISRTAPDGTRTTVNSIAVVPLNTQSIAVDAAGDIYLGTGDTIYKYAPDGSLLTITGSYTAVDVLADGVASQAGYGSAALALGPDGDLYYADMHYNRVRRLTVGGCTTVAQPVISAMVNGASFNSGYAAPGEIMTIFGFSLGPAVGIPGQFDAGGALTSSLSGVSVLFDGKAAPLFYAGAGQINVQVPLAAANDWYTEVRVVYNGLVSDFWTLPVIPSSPGIFGSVVSQGRAAAILNADGSINSGTNPAVRGTYVAVYATGGGFSDPVQPDGIPPQAAASLVLPATVSVNQVPAPVAYAGVAPSLVGATQVNFQVPNDPGLVSGYNPLVLTVGGVTDTSGFFVK